MSSPFAYIAILPVRFYQRFISPMCAPRCRYYPTCSSYALGALHTHGLVKGTILAVWRILRCNPWSLGGSMKFPLAASGLARPGSLRQIGPDTTTLGHGPSWA